MARLRLSRVAADITTAARPGASEAVGRDDAGSVGQAKGRVAVLGAQAERVEVGGGFRNPMYVI